MDISEIQCVILAGGTGSRLGTLRKSLSPQLN